MVGAVAVARGREGGIGRGRGIGSWHNVYPVFQALAMRVPSVHPAHAASLKYPGFYTMLQNIAPSKQSDVVTCSAHVHQGSWMQPKAHALVHCVHCAHRAGGTQWSQGSCWSYGQWVSTGNPRLHEKRSRSYPSAPGCVTAAAGLGYPGGSLGHAEHPGLENLAVAEPLW
jgi:hypothetical protein